MTLREVPRDLRDSLMQPNASGSDGLGAGLCHGSVPADHPDAAAVLARQLGEGPFSRILLFLSPATEIDHLMQGLSAFFDPRILIGCTTAGEITQQGYSEGEIVALGLMGSHFQTDCLVIPDLAVIDGQGLIGEMIRRRAVMADRTPRWGSEFAFLMVDGLSLREDALTTAIAPGLGNLPLFGGSAGDGIRFQATRIIWQGKALSNAAVLMLVRTRCRVQVFRVDHLVPTDVRMVVTEAEPSRRIVRQINAEPAAREYARLLGKDPAQLTTFTFAAHPVVVRLGGGHHVRAIQQVDENGDLIFFSAIDEGLVLTLAEPQDLAAHLERELSSLTTSGQAPAAILACDCILRRMEALEKQKTGAISEVMRKHRVVGFSTYGEQWNSMHVNHTMTGVAIYADEPESKP